MMMLTDQQAQQILKAVKELKTMGEVMVELTEAMENALGMAHSSLTNLVRALANETDSDHSSNETLHN